MAVKIRLARHGRKGRPFYHIVVADSRAPRDGKFIEKIGTHNPMTNPAITELMFDRALYWLNVGAQPTDTTKSILKKEGVLYKKHLMGGVKKGAFDEAAAEQKFETWLNKKQGEFDSQKAKIEAKIEAEEKARLEAEKKINQDRAEALAKKATEASAEVQTEQAPAEESAESSEATEAPQENA